MRLLLIIFIILTFQTSLTSAKKKNICLLKPPYPLHLSGSDDYARYSRTREFRHRQIRYCSKIIKTGQINGKRLSKKNLILVYTNLLNAQDYVNDIQGARKTLKELEKLNPGNSDILKVMNYANNAIAVKDKMERLAQKQNLAAKSIEEENRREWERRERELKARELAAAKEEQGNSDHQQVAKAKELSNPPLAEKTKQPAAKKEIVAANVQPKPQVTIRAGKRIALVIGNDNYSNLPSQFQLKKAQNDARSTAETFSSLGFDVMSGFDLNRRNMNVQLSKLANKIEPGDEVMFFFAGHGVRIEGQNYLLPSDIPPITDANEDLLKAESLRVDSISDMFRKKGARLALLVLDACRNNPYLDTRGRSIGGSRGLAPMDPPEGTLVLFSAGAGQQALDRLSDDDSNPNSVFTRSFLPLVKQQGLELSRLSRLLKGKVRDLAKSVGHKQTPAVYNEVIGDVFLSFE